MWWTKDPFTVWVKGATLSKTETKWIYTGIEPNKKYRYHVRAMTTDDTNLHNDYSLFSGSVTILSLPETPKNLDVYADKKTIQYLLVSYRKL